MNTPMQKDTLRDRGDRSSYPAGKRQHLVAIVVLSIILLLSLATKLHQATQFATFTDEILSATVAHSIAETGLPWLPSGAIYYRAPLHHYLLAVPIGLLGIDYLPMRINSILASLIMIAIVFWYTRQSSGIWLAALAALGLALSASFNQFALSGRMYGPFAMFFVLTIFSAREGYLCGRELFKWLTIVFMVATVLSSEAGLIIAPILGAALLFSGGWKVLRQWTLWLGLLVWMILAYIFLYHEIPYAYTPFTAQSGALRATVIHLGMSTRELFSNLTWPWRTLDRALPFSMAFFLLMSSWMVIKRRRKSSYLLIVVLLILISNSFLGTYVVQHRMVAVWLPLYFACCAYLLGELIGWWRESSQSGTRIGLGAKAILLTLYVAISVVILILNGVRAPGQLAGYIGEAWGYRDLHEDVDMEGTYARLAPLLSSGDRILVSTIEYGWFFLGPQHDYYFLRQHRAGGRDSDTFVPFDAEVEPYFGKPLVDSTQDLTDLLESSSGTVWLVTDYKLYRYGYIGEELSDLIEERFEVEIDDMAGSQSRIYRSGT